MELDVGFPTESVPPAGWHPRGTGVGRSQERTRSPSNCWLLFGACTRLRLAGGCYAKVIRPKCRGDMSQQGTPTDSDVEFELGTDTTGNLVVRGRLPASLPVGLARGLVKACEFGIAGLTPGLYRQATEGMLRTRIQRALTDEVCANISDLQNRELISLLLHNDLAERANRFERRVEIVNQAAPVLESVSAEEQPGPSSIISDEFLLHYWETADRISQVELREIFSRILANEIASPGSFSAATLNLLTTLHPDLARKFETFCRMTFRFEGLSFVITHMPHAEGPSTRTNFVSSSEAKGEALIDFGLTREDLHDLRSIGLIRTSGSEEYPNLTSFFLAPGVNFAGHEACFVIGPDAPREDGFSITDATNVISLTPTGSELRSVIDLAPNSQYATKLIEVMQISNVTMTVRSERERR